ncbi:hypothetical protein Syun_009149 [Stephania yunnanensis]|uniref:Uncharacterized protein n=1 Tax=Stephania yunnanensis TaxID=152371 RepID=A0AAP0KGL9_9MAGN
MGQTGPGHPPPPLSRPDLSGRSDGEIKGEEASSMPRRDRKEKRKSTTTVPPSPSTPTSSPLSDPSTTPASKSKFYTRDFYASDRISFANQFRPLPVEGGELEGHDSDQDGGGGGEGWTGKRKRRERRKRNKIERAERGRRWWWNVTSVATVGCSEQLL